MLDKIKSFLVGLPVGALIGAGLFFWIMGAEGGRFHQQAKIAARPVEALPTTRSIQWPERITQSESGPVVLRVPSEKEAARVTKDYDLQPGELDHYRILGEHDLPRMEWGGSVLSGLDENGRLAVHVKPNPEPLIELPARWTFYAEAAAVVNEHDSSFDTGRRYSIGVHYDALRFARFHLEPFGEAGYRTAGGSYAEGGIRISYRAR